MLTLFNGLAGLCALTMKVSRRFKALSKAHAAYHIERLALHCAVYVDWPLWSIPEQGLDKHL